MQSTRARILGLLRAGGATVEAITADLGLAPATVRRHLDVLLRDGLVEMRSERVPLGRPHFVFTLSEGGLDGLPGRQYRLVSAVLDTILALTPRDTRDRSGSDIAALVFDRLADQLLARCRPAVTATSIPDRLEQATEALGGAGLEFDVIAGEDGFIVTGAGCPCMRLISGIIECPHEARVLSGLIGVPVERVESPSAVLTRSFRLPTGVLGVL